MSKKKYTPQAGDVLSLFFNSIGKIIELKYNNSMNNIIDRKGRLEKDAKWYYLYDKGKANNEFNIAIHEKDLNRIIHINVL